MSFGNTVTALAFADLTPTTLIPCSKSSARNEANLWEAVMAGLLIPAAGSGAGTSYRWKGQNAGSGNSNGGGIILEPGLKAGSGTDGRVIVRQPGGVASTDEAQLYHDGNAFYIDNKDSGGIAHMHFRLGGGEDFRISRGGAGVQYDNGGATPWAITSGLRLYSSGFVTWTSNGSNANDAPDTGFNRNAAGVIATTNGSSGAGWLQHTGGDSRNASNVTNNTTTPAAITGLSSTVAAGRKYKGELTLFLSTDQAAEGMLIDFDGGTATMTSFSAFISSNVQGATLGTTVSSAIATDLNATALNGTGINGIVIQFTFVVSVAGTFIPRIAQNTHASGTITCILGSTMTIKDVP